MMAYDLSSLSNNIELNPPRIIVLGVEKIGKSEFAAGSENPAILPIKGETGLDAIKAWKAPVSNSFSDVLGWLQSLHDKEHSYMTAVIDSASALEPLIHIDVCNRLGGKGSGNINTAGGGYGAGHTEAANTWRQLTDWLDALRINRRMASIVVGHVKVRRFDDPNGESYDQYQWDIHEKAANLLYRWSDVILFCNTKTFVKKEDIGFNKTVAHGIEITPGSRYLYTQKRPAHPGGGRGVYGRLPYELPLSWAHFRDAVATEMAKSTPN